MTLVKMQPVDHRGDIMDRLKDTLPHIDVGNDRVLLAVYVRPDGIKLAGGQTLYTAPTTQKEDAIQGKAALVVAVGPLVNVEGKVDLRGFAIEVGDWVAVNASDGWSMNMGPTTNRVMLRLLGETNIHMRLDDPNLIW